MAMELGARRGDDDLVVDNELDICQVPLGSNIARYQARDEN